MTVKGWSMHKVLCSVFMNLWLSRGDQCIRSIRGYIQWYDIKCHVNDYCRAREIGREYKGDWVRKYLYAMMYVDAIMRVSNMRWLLYCSPGKKNCHPTNAMLKNREGHREGSMWIFIICVFVCMDMPVVVVLLTWKELPSYQWLQMIQSHGKPTQRCL